MKKGTSFLVAEDMRKREGDGFHKDNSLNGYLHIQMFSNYCK